MHPTDGSDQPHAPLPGAASSKTSSPWLAMIPLMIPIVMVNVDITAVNLALAHIARDLHVPLSVVQWVVNGYMMTAGAFLILGSRLGDAWGKRRALVGGVLLFTAGSAAAGASTVGWALIASRMFQGVGFLIMPLSLSLVHDIFPENKKSLAMGVTAAVTGLSISAGPTVGGFIIHTLDWHWVFWINLPLGLLTVVSAYLFLPETPVRPATKFDLGGQTLLALSLFALTAGLNAVAGRQGSPFSMVGLSGAGLLFFILFIFHEKRASEPLMDPELMRNRAFVWANGARLAMQFSYMGFLFLICLFLQNIVLFSPTRSGILLLWITLTMAGLSPLSGALMDKIGVRIPLVTAFFMAAAGYAGISTIGISARMEILIPSFLAIGAAYSVLMPGCNEAALGAVPKEKTGVASGMLYTLVFSGSAVAIGASGLVLHLRASHALSAQLARRGIGLADHQLALLTRAATGLEHGFAEPSFNFCKSLPVLETIAQQSFLTGFATCMYGFTLVCIAGACLAWLIWEPQKKVHPA